MLSPAEVIKALKTQISSLEIDEQEKVSLAKYIAKEIFNLDSLDLILNQKFIEKDIFLLKTKEIIFRLNHNEPIQQILGYSYFYGEKFLVNKDVLIPRHETEGLVELAMNFLSHVKNPLVYDLCTGSGCIAITLAKKIKHAEVYAVDICQKCLNIAQKNAVLHNVNIKFAKSDILKIEKLPQKVDLIVSNPPYIRNSEKQYMNKNVLDYEPHKALFVLDEDPLVFYKKIITIAKESLKSGGILLFEINEAFGQEIYELFQGSGFSDIVISQDLFNRDRFVVGKFSPIISK